MQLSVTNVPYMRQNLFCKYLANLESYRKKYSCFKKQRLKGYYICKSQKKSYMLGICGLNVSDTEKGNYLKGKLNFLKR